MVLTALPSEILGMVVKQVPHRQDLSRLSRTCKSLKAVVLPVLYGHLVLKVPQSYIRLSHVENLLSSRSDGLQYVTSLTISTQLRDGYDDDAEEYPAVDIDSDQGGFSVPHPLLSTLLNSLVRILLNRLPKRRLKDFIWDHGCFMNMATFDCLETAQFPGLANLQIRYFSPEDEYDEFNPIIPGIKSFSLNSVGELDSSDWMSRFLWQHKNSLKHLSLGTESTAIEFYNKPNEALRRGIDKILTDMTEVITDLCCDYDDMDVANIPLLTLTTLDFKGLNVRKLIRPRFLFQDWGLLKSLTLESCYEVEQALDDFAYERNKQGLPLASDLRLHSFHIRHESSSQPFRTRLLGFLSSFRGLVNLSVLLETSDKPLGFEDILVSHGESLKTLVWEERTGRRETFIPPKGYKLPPTKQLREIAQHCPNLVELGVLLDWSNLKTEYFGLDPDPYEVIKCMKGLRTLNIRNMPPLDPKKSKLPLEEMQAAYANSLLQRLDNGEFWDPQSNRMSPEVLAPRTLALGSSTYRVVHIGIGSEYEDSNAALHRFLRLQIYKVESWYQIGGQRTRLATLSETGTYAMTEAEGGDVEILKPYWLG